MRAKGRQKIHSISLCSLKKLSVRSKYICACLQNYCVSPKKLCKREKKKYFNTSAFSQNFWETSRETLRSLTKHLHSLNLNCIRSLNTFAFSCKTIVCPQETFHLLAKLLRFPNKLCIWLQNICVLYRNFALTCKTFAFFVPSWCPFRGSLGSTFFSHVKQKVHCLLSIV